MLSGPEYIKVISYNDSKAKIYYAEENRASASVFTFEKHDGEWVETEWKVIWSDNGGSASGGIRPYFRHFIYGGF